MRYNLKHLRFAVLFGCSVVLGCDSKITSDEMFKSQNYTHTETISVRQLLDILLDPKKPLSLEDQEKSSLILREKIIRFRDMLTTRLFLKKNRDSPLEPNLKKSKLSKILNIYTSKDLVIPTTCGLEKDMLTTIRKILYKYNNYDWLKYPDTNWEVFMGFLIKFEANLAGDKNFI